MGCPYRLLYGGDDVRRSHYRRLPHSQGGRDDEESVVLSSQVSALYRAPVRWRDDRRQTTVHLQSVQQLSAGCSQERAARRLLNSLTPWHCNGAFTNNVYEIL